MILFSFFSQSPTIRLGHRGQIQRQPCLAEEQLRMDRCWLTLQITIRSSWSSWFHTYLSSLVHKLYSLFQIISMLYIAVRVSFKRVDPALCVITDRLYKCIESLIQVSLYYFILIFFLGFVFFWGCFIEEPIHS